MRLIAAMLLLLVLAGCLARNVHTPTSMQANAIDPGFLDLQPGWRLRVVTPISKSGGYSVQSLEPIPGSPGSFKAGPDLAGYENDYYALTAAGTGVHIEFRSAEVVIDGKTTRQSHPAVVLFDLPGSARHIRLIYLVRVSRAEHNMAIVGAEDSEVLAGVTNRVQADPEEECRRETHSYCSWVPAGIAVRPEERRKMNGQKEWRPVQ